MNRICPHCGLDFGQLNGRQFGAHLTNCSMNPKSKEMREKNAISHIVQKFDWLLVCKKCGKIFSLCLSNTVFLSKKHTKYCNACKISRTRDQSNIKKYNITDITQRYKVKLKCDTCNSIFIKELAGVTLARSTYKPICDKCKADKISKGLLKNKNYEELPYYKRKAVFLSSTSFLTSFFFSFINGCLTLLT